MFLSSTPYKIFERCDNLDGDTNNSSGVELDISIDGMSGTIIVCSPRSVSWRSGVNNKIDGLFIKEEKRNNSVCGSIKGDHYVDVVDDSDGSSADDGRDSDNLEGRKRR